MKNLRDNIAFHLDMGHSFQKPSPKCEKYYDIIAIDNQNNKNNNKNHFSKLFNWIACVENKLKFERNKVKNFNK